MFTAVLIGLLMLAGAFYYLRFPQKIWAGTEEGKKGAEMTDKYRRRARITGLLCLLTFFLCVVFVALRLGTPAAG